MIVLIRSTSSIVLVMFLSIGHCIVLLIALGLYCDVNVIDFCSFFLEKKPWIYGDEDFYLKCRIGANTRLFTYI